MDKFYDYVHSLNLSNVIQFSKCPLKFSFVRNLKCLDPKYMGIDASDSVRKFKRVLSSLVTLKRTNASSADDIIRQCKEFLDVTVAENKAEFQTPFRSGNRDRVDCFLSKYMTQTEEYKLLWNLVSMVLCLSHGQATVERGFSINKRRLKWKTCKMNIM